MVDGCPEAFNAGFRWGGGGGAAPAPPGGGDGGWGPGGGNGGGVLGWHIGLHINISHKIIKTQHQFVVIVMNVFISGMT